MDGEFVCEETTGLTKDAVGGGNLLIMGRDRPRHARARPKPPSRAIAAVPDVIMPFPGGIVRSGSKVGSKYKALTASTNDAYCPTLKGRVESALTPDVGSVLEIVIDGLTDDSGRAPAMRRASPRSASAARQPAWCASAPAITAASSENSTTISASSLA